jgi:hypothetical protein
MDEARPVIPLQYESASRRRRGWRIGKAPGDAVLDLVAIVMTLAVNGAFIDETRSRGLVALEAMASMAWTGVLLVGAVLLTCRVRIAPVVHTIWALGKLVLALAAIVAAVTCHDLDLALRVVLYAVAGASFAVLMLLVGVLEAGDVNVLDA